MIFPTLRGKEVGYASVADFADRWLARRPTSVENPLLDPVECQRMIDDMHDALGVEWSYGGWLEDRGRLWRGTYITERNTPLHLGVDLNVPAGTPVASNLTMRCFRVESDHPEPHGWGTRVIMVLGDGTYLVYAHVQDVRCKPGDFVYGGDVFAEVGTPEINGGWFAHLHVQAVTTPSLEVGLRTLAEMDGYGSIADLRVLTRLHPDPLRFIAIR